jgi:ubiquinone/menaquinone biosynthesis C-methylase UbiE
MKKELKVEISEYYNERAKEYEELYKYGGVPASISDPESYKNEAKIISKLLNKFIKAKIVDIACGTGYWLPYYAPNCQEIVLIDQSQKMLDECKKKIEGLGVNKKCELICDDFFNCEFEENEFDISLIGFFLSHCNDEQEELFFNKIKKMLEVGGEMWFLDSSWNEERSKVRGKSGIQERKLSDGRRFEVYKKYFDENDVQAIAAKYKIKFDILHQGKVFIVFKGSFL